MQDDDRLHFVKVNMAKGKMLSLSDNTVSDKRKRTSHKSRKGKSSSSYPILTRISAPSVPNKFQQNGYVESSDGSLRPQDPLPLGFSGIGFDSAGPGDYEPKALSKHHSTPSVVFPRSERPPLESLKEWVSTDLAIPGPGQYNTRSSFDDSGLSLGIDGEFEELESTGQTRETASFRSTVERTFPLHRSEAELREEPGPATYNIPTTVWVQRKPASRQCFNSTSSRFATTVPRSLRLATAPGQYNPLTSSFDISRREIEKRKRLLRLQGSSWAQSVGFTTSSSRFQSAEGKDGPTAPQDYQHEILDDGSLGRGREGGQRRRGSGTGGGPFGSTAKRFYTPDVEREQGAVAVAATAPFLAPQTVIPPGFAAKSRVGQAAPVLDAANSSQLWSTNTVVGRRSRSSDKGLAQSSFFKNSEERIVRDVMSPAPAVGYYDTSRAVKWEPKGVLPMIPPSPKPHKPGETEMPGPGQYNLPSPIAENTRAHSRNRKNVLVSTDGRFEYQPLDVPGPGSYDPQPLYGTLVVPSHNVTYLKAP